MAEEKKEYDTIVVPDPTKLEPFWERESQNPPKPEDLPYTRELPGEKFLSPKPGDRWALDSMNAALARYPPEVVK